MSEHPVRDWLAILVPAIAIVYAAFATYRRQERTRRQLARPLVAVQHRLDPTEEPFIRWIVEIRNESDTAVNIESITVVAGEDIIEPEPLEPPREYWSRVLYSAGVLRVQQVQGNVILPTRSLSGKSEILLFDAYIGSPRENVSNAIQRIEIRLKCRSAAGETSVIHHRYGRN